MSHAPFDPIALGESIARTSLTQDGRHLRAVPGAGGVPGQVRPGKPVGVQTFTLSARSVQTLLAALGGSGSSVLHAIADDLSGQVHPSLLPSADWCSPTGMERPL